MQIFWFSSWIFFSSWWGKGHESSRAELKILQLELWLEPARLGLITNKYISTYSIVQKHENWCYRISDIKIVSFMCMHKKRCYRISHIKMVFFKWTIFLYKFLNGENQRQWINCPLSKLELSILIWHSFVSLLLN